MEWKEKDVCMAPYPGFGMWPAKIVKGTSRGVVQVMFFDEFNEVVRLHIDKITALPRALPKSMKTRKKKSLQTS